MRFIVFIGGKWQGGSFVTEAEAKAVAEKICAGTSKTFEVQSKGGIKPKPKAEPKK